MEVHMKGRKVWWQLFAVLILLAVFFIYLFYADNKYQTPPPYGRFLTLEEQDLDRGAPIYLIDGWRLRDGRGEDRFTYIGEFSNLQRGNLWISPHGWACYQLVLRYEGSDRIVSVDFPQLSSQYIVSLNGRSICQGAGSGRITSSHIGGAYSGSGDFVRDRIL